jgi:Na+/phosphate symporter
LHHEALKIEKLGERPVSESVSLEEGLLIMISKLIEMCGLLSKAVFTGDAGQMDACEALANEVHEQEKLLTKDLVGSGIESDLLTGVIRFPYRLERIGDMFESILNCCRIKARNGVPFSDKAYAELDELFSILLEMMHNLRDAFQTPNKEILEAIVSSGFRLSELFEEFKLAHWRRLESGFCAAEASSMYRDILDSAKSASEYLVKMAQTLKELGQTAGSRS